METATPAGQQEIAERTPDEILTTGEKRDSTEGRWLMSIMKPQFSLPGMTIDLSPGKTPEIVATSQVMDTWKVLESEIGEQEVAITFSNVNGDPVVVRATLDQSEALRGSAVYGIDGLDFVEFVPAAEVDLSEVKRNPLPAAREFAAVLQANREMVPADVREFAVKLSATPVKISIYQQLLQNGVMSGTPIEEVLQDADSLIEAAAPWGQRFQAQQAMLVVASLTSLSDVPIENLKEWYEKTKTLAGDEPTDQIATALSIGKAAVAASDETLPVEDAQAAVDELVAVLPHQSVTYRIRSTLAKRKGDEAEALKIESELVALPMPGGDPKAVEDLYTKVHGSTDGLPAYLDGVYEDVLTAFASEEAEGVGTTPVLVELFTGGSCPPCVAADVAIEAVERTFPENVHVIRYHMDIPAPDPLATTAGQQRFSDAYRLQGTPSIVVNGVPQQIPGTIGPYPFAKVGYANLSSLVTLLSNEEPTAKVSAAAVVKGDTIRVIARAESLPADSNPSIVVALVSDSLQMLMPNGIREHGMVVRAFPAGPVGVAQPKPEAMEESPDEDSYEAKTSEENKAKSEGFEIVTETSLKELEEKLVAALSVGEEVIEANRDTITNLDDLSAIAFVQDGTTGRILASTQVKVSPPGSDAESEPTETPAKPAPKAAESKDAPAEKTSKPAADTSAKKTPAADDSNSATKTDGSVAASPGEDAAPDDNAANVQSSPTPAAE